MHTLAVVENKTGLESLSDSELAFVKHLLADDLWRPFVAAKKAGYKKPREAANRLMKRPVVSRALGKELRRRLERLDLKADEVLNVLATGLFFNPLSLFKPTSSGKWAVEDLDKIPVEIGRLVTKVKTRTEERLDESGNVVVNNYFELEVMDKTRLLELAMKHCGVDGTKKVEYSGNVGLQLGGELSTLLMTVEQTRSGQVIDDNVIEGKIVKSESRDV